MDKEAAGGGQGIDVLGSEVRELAAAAAVWF
jgi:hypothetical protein